MNLSDIFKIKGIKTYEDLNKEERETYRQMEEVLKEEMSLDRVKQYIESQIKNLTIEIANPDNLPQKDLFLKARIRDLTALSFFIDSPKMAKEKLEDYLLKVGLNKL